MTTAKRQRNKALYTPSQQRILDAIERKPYLTLQQIAGELGISRVNLSSTLHHAGITFQSYQSAVVRALVEERQGRPLTHVVAEFRTQRELDDAMNLVERAIKTYKAQKGVSA